MQPYSQGEAIRFHPKALSRGGIIQIGGMMMWPWACLQRFLRARGDKTSARVVMGNKRGTTPTAAHTRASFDRACDTGLAHMSGRMETHFTAAGARISRKVMEPTLGRWGARMRENFATINGRVKAFTCPPIFVLTMARV